MMKRIGLGILVLVLLASAGAYVFMSRLDVIVKAAVETYGQAATQAVVKLDSVSLSIKEGRASLKGLFVGNPPSFQSKRAFELGEIAVTLDPASVMGSGALVLREVSIENPQLSFEVLANGDNNLQALARNAQNYAAHIAPEQEKKAATETKGKAEAGRKIIIEKLSITGGKIEGSHALLPQQKMVASLPPILLKDIGKDKGGASAAEVADIIVRIVADNATRVALPNMTKQLEMMKGAVVQKVGDQINKATGGVVGKDALGGAVKGLLGK